MTSESDLLKIDPPNDTMVLPYVRVSTESQDESLAGATDTMKAWLKTHGYKHNKVYVETGSGAKAEGERTEWLDMLQYAEDYKRRNPNMNVLIVVREVSRFAREVYDFFYFLRPLRMMGIQLYSINNQILTSTPDEPRPNDDMLFAIFEGLAMQAREESRERTIEGIARSRKKGKTGGSVPLLTATLDLGQGKPKGTGYRQMWATARKDYNPNSVVDTPVQKTGKNFPHPITNKPRESNTIRNLLEKMKEYDAAGVLEGWFETMDVLTDLQQFIGPAVPAGKVRGAPSTYRPRKTPSRLQTLMRGYSAYLQDPINFEEFKPTKEELLEEAGISLEEFEA